MQNDRMRFCIVLYVSTGVEELSAEAWFDDALPAGTPKPGDQVSLAVRVRSYVQGGGARHALVWGGESRGEPF